MSEWIDCRKKLPPKGENILLYAPIVPEDYKRDDGPIFVGYWEGNNDCDMDRRYWDCIWGDNWVPFGWLDVTHWMPLPKPPLPQ